MFILKKCWGIIEHSLYTGVSDWGEGVGLALAFTLEFHAGDTVSVYIVKQISRKSNLCEHFP